MRHWSRSYGQAATVTIIMRATPPYDALLPAHFICTGSRKSKLFRIAASEFPTDLVPARRVSALVKLHGLNVPPEFIEYFQATIISHAPIPLAVLDVVDNTADDIAADLEDAFVRQRARLSYCDMAALVASIERPNTVYLCVDTPVWNDFWTVAARYRVRRVLFPKPTLASLEHCTYVVDIDEQRMAKHRSDAGPDYSNPTLFFRYFEMAFVEASENWVITKRDAFLVLFILACTHPRIIDLLKPPFAQIKGLA